MDITPDEITDIALLIQRGDFDHAQRLTSELLSLHPSSGPAHALMGDLAAARRDHREAVDWYELSLRLADSPAVAARLSRQRELLAAASEAEVDDLLTPAPGRRRLLMAGIIGGFVLVALLIWLLAAVLPRHKPVSERARIAGAPQGAVRPNAPGEAAAPPLTPGTPPAAAGGRPSTAATPGLTPAAPAASPNLSGRPINITQSVDAPMSNRDRLLTRALAGMTWPTGEALGWRIQAAVDDFTGYAMITVQISPGVRSAGLSDTVIDMAYKLAVATIQSDKGIMSMTLRFITDVDVEGKRISLLAFRGNTKRDYLDYYLKRGLQPDRQTIWAHVFATTWWNPSVPTGTEAAATP